MRIIRTHGMVRQPKEPLLPEYGLDPNGQPNPWYYEMPEVGWNYRLSDIHAALGRSQLRKLAGFTARRAAIVTHYDTTLAKHANRIKPLHRVGGKPGWHLYVVQIDFAAVGKDRASVMRALSAKGIGTQVHYLPVHLQPYYQRRYGRQTLPGAEAYYARCLSLPLFPTMTDSDVDRVVETLVEVLGS
jgi:dTDP-4-amino-4,6-dideoxygalactose transaminase